MTLLIKLSVGGSFNILSNTGSEQPLDFCSRVFIPAFQASCLDIKIRLLDFCRQLLYIRVKVLNFIIEYLSVSDYLLLLGFESSELCVDGILFH